MKESAPEWGADTDDYHRTDPDLGMPTACGRCLLRDGFDDACDRVSVAVVRVSSSNADANQFCYRESSDSVFVGGST